jgi:hypothetical protein
MGMSLSREILIWGATVLVAAVLAVIGTDYVFNHFIFPPDTQDPLAMQGGLKPEQINAGASPDRRDR